MIMPMFSRKTFAINSQDVWFGRDCVCSTIQSTPIYSNSSTDKIINAKVEFLQQQWHYLRNKKAIHEPRPKLIFYRKPFRTKLIFRQSVSPINLLSRQKLKKKFRKIHIDNLTRFLFVFIFFVWIKSLLMILIIVVPQNPCKQIRKHSRN